MKDLCQNWKVKLFFRGAYRLSGTGIVECLEIIDVGCNLKQFDNLIDMTDPDPRILRQIYATACISLGKTENLQDFYTGRTHYLTPNQQRQIVEDISLYVSVAIDIRQRNTKPDLLRVRYLDVTRHEAAIHQNYSHNNQTE